MAHGGRGRRRGGLIKTLFWFYIDKNLYKDVNLAEENNGYIKFLLSPAGLYSGREIIKQVECVHAYVR